MVCKDTPSVIKETMYNLYECMAIPVTYKGETFCVDVDFKIGYSWGKMAGIELRSNNDEVANLLQELKK